MPSFDGGALMDAQGDMVPEHIKKYTGAYVHEGFGKIDIYLKNNDLYFRIGDLNHKIGAKDHQSFAAYYKEFDEGYKFEFIFDSNNKIIGLKSDIVDSGGELTFFEKK